MNQVAMYSNTLTAHHTLFKGLEQYGVDKEDMFSFCAVDEIEADEDLSDLPDYARDHYDNWLAFYVSLIEKKDAETGVYEHLGVSD